MTIHRIESFEDAKLLVDSYQLTDWDKGLGSSDGFAAWLYLNATSVATEGLGRRIDEYLRACIKQDALGFDFDAMWVHEATLSAEDLRYAQASVKELASVARAAKRVEVGRLAWSLIAELATSTEPSKRCATAPFPVVQRAWQTLRHLKSMEHLMMRAEYHTYVPGRGSEDELMRAAIERLDEAPVTTLWFEREVHWPAEVDALLKLLEHVDLSSPGNFIRVPWMDTVC